MCHLPCLVGFVLKSLCFRKHKPSDTMRECVPSNKYKVWHFTQGSHRSLNTTLARTCVEEGKIHEAREVVEGDRVSWLEEDSFA